MVKKDGGGQTARGVRVFFKMDRAGIQLGLGFLPRALIPCGKYFTETKRRHLTSKLTAKQVQAAAATDSAGCHRDSIISLASIKLSQRLLISSSRDGALKVWK
ncbi:unnamed protein product [Dovyalis caffra]|uniref:Uncharacterized protein n=1 Tax=Dovyalis caffra TaxID=77055 RepID=A0AAV1RLT7_9ROSI|nr:unnamed protein product [Dovyalis caffra]